MTGPSEPDRYADERLFAVDHLARDLKGRSVRGGATLMGNQALKFVLRLGSTMVLARLLTPGEFGRFAMVFSITGILIGFKDLGLAMATVQRSQVNREQISTLFWVNVTVGVVLFAACSVLAPAIAWFYDDPRLAWIAVALGAEFVFGGLGVQHEALLRRQMRFRLLTVIEVAAMAAGVVVAVTAAAAGAGYWALVLLPVSTSVFNTAMLWALGRWRPGRPMPGTGVRSMIAFGKNIALVTALNDVALRVDSVLIGRFWGAASLGLYSKAFQLILLPVQQIIPPLTRVAIPTLSRLQESPERFRRYYFKAVLLVAALGMPVVMFLFVAADKFVLLLLGDQWQGAVVIFRLLGPVALLETFSFVTGWIFIPLGQSHRQLRWQLFGSSVTLLAIVIGLRWGPVGVAAAVSIARILLRYPALAYCYRGAPIRITLRELFATLWRPAAAAALAGAGLFALYDVLPFHGRVVAGFFFDAVFYAALYLVSFALLPGGRGRLIDLVLVARSLRRAPDPSAAAPAAGPVRAHAEPPGRETARVQPGEPAAAPAPDTPEGPALPGVTRGAPAGPIFVVGCARSGTTLLQRMLDAHPLVAIAGETHFIPRFWLQRDRYGDLERDVNFQNLIRDIIAVPEFAEMELDAGAFEARAAGGERTYAALFGHLLALFAEARGAEVVGEKTPDHLVHAPVLLRFFPGAKFVHLVRDPRAVVNSWRNVPWSTGSLATDAEVWRRHMAIVRGYPPAVRRSFLTLSYERLLGEPEEQLRSLCRFLGLDFDAGMLEYHRSEPRSLDVDREPWKRNATRPIDRASADRWRSELSSGMITAIEAVVWWEMRRFGYRRCSRLPAFFAPAVRAAARRYLAGLRRMF